jgi:hypothetical protein
MAAVEYVTREGIATNSTSLRSFLSKVSLLVATTLLVLFYRRPDQFLHPYIWVEDGTYNLKAFAERGAWSLFEPVAGYLVLASKLITLSAYKLSFLWAPEIAAALTVTFTCCVTASIAFAPTHLRWRPLCALLAIAVPTNSEVFAVSEYAFWWAGLWIILALVWDTDKGKQALRLFFLILGGLSSPIIIPLSGLFVLRAAIDRRRSETICAGMAVLIGAAQAAILHFHAGPAAPIGKSTIPLFVEKFLGLFIGTWGGSADVSVAIGWAVALLIAIAAFLARRRLDRPLAILALSWVCVTVVVLFRYPLSVIDPFTAGPRYFFYGFILLGWNLIWLAAESKPFMSALLLAVLALGIVRAVPHLPRRHDAVDWRQQIARCAKSKEYDLPIHFAGSAQEMWQVRLRGVQCQALLDGSLL